MKVCDVDGCDRRHEYRGLCHAHAERRRRGVPLGGPFPETPLDRMAEKIHVEGDCWMWTGATDGGGRYGSIYNSATKKVERAHRRAYELLVGPVEDGLVIDHLCRRTLCVNPDHLDQVTQRENILRGFGIPAANARKTHCVNGHEYAMGNTLRKGPDGRQRACRECRRVASREGQRRRRQRIRQEADAA